MCERPSSWVAWEKFGLNTEGQEDLEEAISHAVPRDSGWAADLKS